ncbi:unnamed protein product [Arctia plantaginis]|uniref:Cytochrome b5 heme-binding domain-containing protein n=1 Tax=Arctia plantaginis TaxID=874455 RepID=A0A8S0Z6J0_ARCPL|nr:unnamed protein product [Arctia plantaginis]CAB3251058.1 unnamed protein product [Arctia plantaginis]
MSVGKFLRKDIESRNTRNNANIIIDNVVYDVTEFLQDHPGGVDVLLDNAGKDASKCFAEVGHSDIALEWRQKFVIGEVVDEDKWEVEKKETHSQQESDQLSLSSVLNVWGPPIALGLLAMFLYSCFFS